MENPYIICSCTANIHDCYLVDFFREFQNIAFMSFYVFFCPPNTYIHREKQREKTKNKTKNKKKREREKETDRQTDRQMRMLASCKQIHWLRNVSVYFSRLSTFLQNYQLYGTNNSPSCTDYCRKMKVTRKCLTNPMNITVEWVEQWKETN